MKWASSAPKLTATDALLDQLPNHEQEALDKLRERTDSAIKELSESLPECDSWRNLRDESHWQLRDEILLRFLRFNGLNVDKSAVQMEEALKWRGRSMVATLSEDIIKGMQVGLPIAQLTEPNEQGDVLYVCLSDAYIKAQVDHEQQETAVGKMFDIILYSPNGPQAKQGFIVVDFTNLGWNNIDLIGVKNGIIIFLNYFPDVFGKIMFVNYPRIVHGIWKAVAPLLDPRTRSRVVWLATPSELQHALAASFKLQNVPSWMGGHRVSESLTLYNGLTFDASDLIIRFHGQPTE